MTSSFFYSSLCFIFITTYCQSTTVRNFAQLTGAAEYTDCISVEESDSSNECPVYDTKQSDAEASVMLELWGMQSTPLLPSLSVPLWLGVVAPDRVLSVDQIELKCVLMLNWTVWNRTVCNKNGFGINNLQWLMCHKTKPVRNCMD